MNKFILIIIFSISILGCGSRGGHFGQEIDSRIVPLFQEFSSQCQDYNYDCSPAENISFLIIPETYKAVTCEKTSTGVILLIEESYWNSQNSLAQEWLFYNSLGGCAFNKPSSSDNFSYFNPLYHPDTFVGYTANKTIYLNNFYN